MQFAPLIGILAGATATTRRTRRLRNIATILLLFTAGNCGNESTGPGTLPPPESLSGRFDLFWETFDTDYSYFAYSFGAELTRDVSPRGAFQFTRPVIVLSGRGVFSSNESFIAAMRELPNVTILGDTTGGGSGNPRTYPLGDGWSYSVSRWIEWTADRRVIEWNGIPPDVFVAWDTVAVRNDRDPVLEAALARLGTAITP